MKDIKRAMEIEKEYQMHRLNGELPFVLADKMKEYGFETLGEYFDAKRDYNFDSLNFNVVETTPLKAIGEVLNAIATKQPTVIMVDIEQTVVWPRKNAEYNEGYCIENNIPILHIPSAGNGTLVSLAGDWGVGICVPKMNGVSYEYILDGFVKIFRRYTDKTVKNEGNDIMVDDKKVCGFAFFETPDVIMAISPVSIVEKSELISKICLKKQQKIPSHIDFMDRETLKQEVSKWLSIQYT